MIYYVIVDFTLDKNDLAGEPETYLYFIWPKIHSQISPNILVVIVITY